MEITRHVGPLPQSVADFLRDIFVGEGFTEPAVGEATFNVDALQARGTLWIATAQGMIVGTVVLVEARSPCRQIATEGELEVHLLAVSPHHRKAGIGESLLRTAVCEAEERRAERLVLSTRPTMYAAHALYEKSGFGREPQRDWSRPDGRTYLAYVMRLRRGEDG